MLKIKTNERNTLVEQKKMIITHKARLINMYDSLILLSPANVNIYGRYLDCG